MADIKAAPEQPAEFNPEPDSEPALAWAGRLLGYVIIGCATVLVLFLTIWAVREIIAHW